MTDEANENSDEVAALAIVDGDEVETEPCDVPADADVPAVLEPILGATPAEAPDVEPVVEASAETPKEKYARLLKEGVKRSQLTAITNAKGELTDVKVQ